MPMLRFAQLRYLSIILFSWLLVFLTTRSVLLITHLHDAQIHLSDLFTIYGIGLIYDLSFLIYAIIPLAITLALIPKPVWQQTWFRSSMHLITALSLFVMFFVALSEWVFWDEFGVRFNFIAVDYLVYSDEVINNILESYPVYPLLALLAVIASCIGALLKHQVTRAIDAPLLPIKGRVILLSGLLMTATLTSTLITQEYPSQQGGNTYQNELANNGPYQFFAAFRNNELDYPQFYASLPEQEANQLIHQELAEPNALFNNAKSASIRRAVHHAGETNKLNVILITVESLSAKYLGVFGDQHGLTPNLDQLSKQSLNFTNFFATGTRTTRGLEAITLSIPPTPGRSIVKRIGRESGFASLGQQLSAAGYDSVFMYGGQGYFDNMNAFFSGNGYRVVDQNSIAKDEVTFANAWGMSDEDLYSATLKQADSDYSAGTPFYLQLMTTSNHRPYTYPEGRVDIPSGTGRYGAVKYTDYAIGQFIQQARKKPWFDNTLFIVVADHTAGSAGKEDLPVMNYHIPLLIYAPKWIAPREISELSSQIDLAPTLLGLLNLDYTSTFFGRDLLTEHAQPGRALISNYQHLGFFDGNSLAILSPQKLLRRHDDAVGISVESAATPNDNLIRRAIAYYQSASKAYHDGLLSWQESPQPQQAKHNIAHRSPEADSGDNG